MNLRSSVVPQSTGNTVGAGPSDGASSDRSLNILILGQYFWPESFRINEVAATLKLQGHHVVVLTAQPNYPSGKTFAGYRPWRIVKDAYQDMAVYRVPHIPRGRANAVSLVLNYTSFIVTGSLLAPFLLRKERIDVIFVYATSPVFQIIPAILLKRILRRPLVSWIQDLWPESLRITGHITNTKLLNLIAVAVRWVYRQNDLLLGQSNSFVQALAPLAGNTPVLYHPNPGELAFSNPSAATSPSLQLDAGFNVLFAGNLGVAQALDTLLQAAAHLIDYRDVRLVFVGSGSRSGWLAAQTQSMGLTNVVIAGRFPPEDMPGIFAQASVLLVSLAKDPVIAQTVPSKIPAYLAAGQPIIGALDGEGAQVIAQSGAGFTCAAEDSQSLAETILRMRALSPDERKAMGQNGKAYYAENFEPQMLGHRLAKILRDRIDAPH